MSAARLDVIHVLFKVFEFLPSRREGHDLWTAGTARRRRRGRLEGSGGHLVGGEVREGGRKRGGRGFGNGCDPLHPRVEDVKD